MDAFFLRIVNMSIAAGWLILAVVALRPLLKRAPKWIACLLWAAVAIRLICPFSFESVWSLIPSAETISPDMLYAREPVIHSGIPAINSAVNPVMSEALAPAAGASVNPLQIWTALASYVWLFGAAAMLLYAFISYLRLRKRVKASLNVGENIRLCDDIQTPFILGLVRPRIYLPSDMDSAQRAHVVAHETAHLKRRDHWWKPLGFLLLTVYWFNPLCWLAYILLCRDIELACDEKVIRTMERDEVIAYSEALLLFSVPRRMVTACPLAFGEVSVKSRIKTVLNYRKPAFWLMVAAIIACVVVALCFLTNPARPPIELDGMHITWAKTLDLRPNEPTSRDLTDAQLGELKLRLLDLEIGRKDGDFGGFTPLYSLSIQAQSHPQFMIAGYDTDGSRMALLVENEYYRLDDPDFARYLSAVCAEADTAAAQRALTLDDVLALSEKGEALTWADFEGFAHIDTGSGLYIRVYEIDERFSLMIGGPEPSQEPWYIRLVSQADHDEYVDIRTEDLEAFIAEQQSKAGVGVPLIVVSNGNTVTPYQNFLWASDWNGTGWLAADGVGIINMLPEIARELPTVMLSDGIDLIYGENASFSYLSVFDESYERIHHNVSFDQLSLLTAGMYYVSVVVKVQGEYITEGKDFEVKGYECIFKLIVSDVDPLDAAVSAAILEHNKGRYREGDFACESHVILATEAGGPAAANEIDTTTVFAMVFYKVYDFTDAAFERVSGSHIPTALTFHVSEDGAYALREYWEPRDGSFYPSDIREKFPEGAAENALDAQQYILPHRQNCYAQAVEYGKVDTERVIGQLLDTIMSSPAASSQPGDYIDAHAPEYRELTYYGDYTLRYCFTEFLKGGQTGLKGHIMRSVMDELIGDEAIKLSADTGQAYFDAWRAWAEQARLQNGDDYMRENLPKAWLLLQMMDEANR